MKDRVKKLRKTLNITQDEFGHRIGVTGAAVSGYESGRRSLNETVLKSICREFNVDYEWLTEGTGEMKIKRPSNKIDEIAIEYNLNNFEKQVVSAYLEMNDQERKVIRDYFINLTDKIHSDK